MAPKTGREISVSSSVLTRICPHIPAYVLLLRSDSVNGRTSTHENPMQNLNTDISAFPRALCTQMGSSCTLSPGVSQVGGLFNIMPICMQTVMHTRCVSKPRTSRSCRDRVA